MESVHEKERKESLGAVRSAVGKTRKALMNLNPDSFTSRLAAGRLRALSSGLEALECIWNGEAFRGNREETIRDREVLMSLIPSIREIGKRFPEGSPQHTLIRRRVRALELAIQALTELSGECFPDRSNTDCQEEFND